VGVAARPGSALRSPQAGQSRASVCVIHVLSGLCPRHSVEDGLCPFWFVQPGHCLCLMASRFLSLPLMQMLQLPIEKLCMQA